MGLLKRFRKLDAVSQTALIATAVIALPSVPFDLVVGLVGALIIVGPPMLWLGAGYLTVFILMCTPIWLPILLIVMFARKYDPLNKGSTVPDTAVMAFKALRTAR